jgi:hypothetical protein
VRFVHLRVLSECPLAPVRAVLGPPERNRFLCSGTLAGPQDAANIRAGAGRVAPNRSQIELVREGRGAILAPTLSAQFSVLEDMHRASES